MANEENQQACVNETKKSPLQIPQVFNRLVQLPIVKSTCEKVSGMYERTKEYSLLSMVGLSAAEVSINAVMVAAKVTYTSLPSSGVMGKVKEGFEEKVFQADSMACDGLTFLENKWPIIKDNTEQVIAIGAKKLEQSDIAEVLLTVTEAAIEYFVPPKEKCIEEGAAESPVIMRAASVPGRVTVAAIDSAKAVATWSWGIPQILLQKVTERLGRRKNPTRSTRYKPKAEYSRIIDASQPFPVSPERKRRYDREDEDNTSIVELIHVSEDYISDEDPDYVPDKADLESSEDEEDDDEDDDEDEDKKNEEGDSDETETVENTESKKSPPENEEKTNPKESKETGKEGEKERNGEVKKTHKKNISVQDKKKTESKVGEPNNSHKNDGKEVDDKERDLQEKDAKMAAKRGEKSGSPRKVEGRIVM
ncbi:hypothetical protein AWC38_SpisGene133 [Stylophora pistillata]|uniref:Uncharacterized protein n=1 Tax=Stylophora pistillata TaxID=50429 RepID=A0A2B4T0N2_STYPI|nr:hypothetical protein AWC38_SpisGene133 [Stylophora pistillata]